MKLRLLLGRLPYSLLVASLAICAAGVPVPVGSVELQVLTPDDFQDTISNGVWFIEHFSPYCGHCRRFAPTWEQLVEENQKQDNPGIRLAQVNCAVHGDLCQKNQVDAYPQMNLYKNGEYVETFKKPREIETLREYLNAHAEPKTSPPKQNVQLVGEEPGKIYNPTGAVLLLDEGNFDGAVQDGNIFIKFFAPWCGHCKKLAPTWAELANTMRGKMTIAEIDCEAHGSICRTQGITGYPMLFYYGKKGSHKTEYTGGRKLEQLKAFTSKVSEPAVRELAYNELEREVIAYPVVYILLHPASDRTSLHEISEASHILFGSPPVYASSAESFYTRFSLDRATAHALVFKDHNYAVPVDVYSLASSSSLHSEGRKEPLQSWLERNRLPTSLQLDSDNFQDVMNAGHKPLVVLVSAPSGEVSKIIEQVQDLAQQWKDGKYKGDVIFASMDAGRWGNWLKSMYGIPNDGAPHVVVTNHSRLIYYDTAPSGAKLTISSTTIFPTIAGALSGSGSYKYSENFVERFAKYLNEQLISIENMVSNHPWGITFIVLSFIVAVVLFLRKLIAQETVAADDMARKARLD